MITKGRVITKDKVIEWANSVAVWNRVACGGEHNFTKGTKELQAKLVDEELREAFEAVNSKVRQDTLQELIDCFIVISYQSFLNRTGNTEDLFEYTFHEEDSVNGWKDVLRTISLNLFDNKVNQDPDLDLVIAALVYCESLGWDVCSAVEEVLAANWSKFVPMSSLEDETVVSLAQLLTEECKWIEDTHNKKDVDFSFVGDYVVYRDQRGKGKILKSSTFKEANIKQYIKVGEDG